MVSKADRSGAEVHLESSRQHLAFKVRVQCQAIPGTALPSSLFRTCIITSHFARAARDLD